MADMTLQRSDIIETPAGWRAEILFADAPNIDEAAATILIEIPIANLPKYPRFVEAEVEALRIARDVIGQAYTPKKQIVDRKS